MIQKAKQFWASLPHPAQALILAVTTAAGTAFAHAIEEGNCFSTACLKHYAGTAIAAGLVAARAFYMVPNRGTPPAGPNPGAPAQPQQAA